MHKYCCGNALENQQSITACGKGALGQSGAGMGRQTAWGLDDLVPRRPQVRPVLATMQPGAVVEVQVS
jgi:hypothetical protein